MDGTKTTTQPINCSMKLHFFNMFLETLNCAFCCIEEYTVCGDEMDCDPKYDWIVLIVSAAIMLFFLILTVYCLICYCAVGRKVRQKFIEEVLYRDHQLKDRDNRNAIILGTNVPKNIPLKIAEVEDEFESVDEISASNFEVNLKDKDSVIGLEAAPQQRIQIHDYTAVDNKIYQQVVNGDLDNYEIKIDDNQNKRSQQKNHSEGQQAKKAGDDNYDDYPLTEEENF